MGSLSMSGPSYCHNPTNNPKQLKPILLGWYYYRLKKPPHHTGTDYIWRQPRKMIFVTRRNMEEDLNIFENGRQPQFFLKEEDINLFENGRWPQTNDATKNHQK
jgi:hypothetical protein